jgi:ribonuclease-3
LKLLSFFRFNKENKRLSKRIKKITGLYPQNILLYKMAVTHKGVGHKTFFGLVKENNERLEYLGDAVLDLVVADIIFKKFPLKDEGFLTNMRSKIVSRDQLNHIANKIGLLELMQVDDKKAIHNNSLGGNAFEALVGAVYLDRGFKKAYKFIKNRIIDRYLDLEQLVESEISYKAKMFEYAHKFKKTLKYSIINQFKKGNDNYYHVQVVLDDEILADAVNHSKKKAEEVASEKAYSKVISLNEIDIK